MENITWENMMTLRALTPLVIFYLVFFWVLPMLGSTNHKNLPKEDLLPYWTAVWQISGLFHIAAVIVGILLWLLFTYSEILA